jgi:D-glycero-D-manno-heptose 1,7-bisphosphate phosphatase
VRDTVKRDKETRRQGDKERAESLSPCLLVSRSPCLPSPRPAVFLDRDGVLNRTSVRDGTPCPPSCLEEVEILAGVPEALQLLAGQGFPLIVVTNQPDVARGTQTAERVEQINQFLMCQLPLTAVYTCCHDNTDNCDCRKPRPGMLLRAAKEHAIDLSRSFMVGDRWGDVEAGRAAGCKTILIPLPYSQAHRCSPDARAADLAEAARLILRMTPRNLARAAGP